MAFILFALVIVGTYMAGLERTDPPRDFLYSLHKSFGALFLQMAIIRIMWVLYSRPPQLPGQLSSWEKLLSKTVIASLYMLLIAIPVSGIAISNFYGAPVSFFGLFEFPAIFNKNLQMVDTAKTLHMVLVYVSLSAVFLHVAGALKHRFFDAEDADVLHRMLPSKN